MSLTTDMLHELFYYEEGKLFWKVDRKRVKAGDEAGRVDHKGYKQVMINYKNYQAHRLIYILVHGHIPHKLRVDHIDGDPSNNNIENLRAVTDGENQHNQRKARGYSFCKRKNKYHAQIKVAGKTINIGYFDTEEEAREAYLEAKKKYHPSTPNDYFA